VPIGFETWPAKMGKDPAPSEKIHSWQVDILLNADSLYMIHEGILSAPHTFKHIPGRLLNYAGLKCAPYRGDKNSWCHGPQRTRWTPKLTSGPSFQALFPLCEEDNALSLSFSKRVPEWHRIPRSDF